MASPADLKRRMKLRHEVVDAILGNDLKSSADKFYRSFYNYSSSMQTTLVILALGLAVAALSLSRSREDAAFFTIITVIVGWCTACYREDIQRRIQAQAALKQDRGNAHAKQQQATLDLDRALGGFYPLCSSQMLVVAVLLRLWMALASSPDSLDEWFSSWVDQSNGTSARTMWVIYGVLFACRPSSTREKLLQFCLLLAGGLLIGAAIAVRLGDPRGVTYFAPVYVCTVPVTFALTRTFISTIVKPLCADGVNLQVCSQLP